MKISNAIISIILAVLMIATPLGVFTVMASASGPQPNAPLAGGSFGGGNGTAGNPYIIEDVTDLQNMSANLSAHYVLGNDIDASATSGWNGEAGFAPVGNDTKPFNGSLDGAGHEILNLSINRSSVDYVGLFGHTSPTSMIQNLTLSGMKVVGKDEVGGLAGMNSGNIMSCSASGSVHGNNNTGGLAGSNSGNVTDSFSEGTGIQDIYLDVPTDMAAHWKMNEASWVGAAGEVEDSTGNGHNGTINGNPDTAAGKWGNAGAFDGVDDYVQIPYSSGTNPNIFTISLWARADSGAGTFRSPITSRDIIPERGYMMYATDTNVWRISVGTGSGWTSVSGSAVVNGEWMHLVAEYDGSTLSFYNNNVKVGEVATAFSPNTVQEMRIAAGATEGAADFYFNGSIDDVRIFHRAITEVEIDALYNLGVITVQGIDGNAFVGGIAGNNSGGTITGSYNIGNISGDVNIGGVAGYSSGTVSDSRNYANLNTSNNILGGLVGRNNGDIINSSSTGNITSSGHNVGGLVGRNDLNGNIAGSYNTGNVTGGINIGGVVGTSNGNIAGVYNTGNVTGDINVGGIAGYNNGSIADSANYGNANASDTCLGGLVGWNYGNITNSFNIANIISTSTTNDVGGLVGWNKPNGNIAGTYSTGNVYGNYRVGGLVGLNGGTIRDTYSTGSARGNDYLGGFAGINEGSIYRSTGAGDATGRNYAGGFVGYNLGDVYDSYGSGDTVSDGLRVGGFAGYNGALGEIVNSSSTGSAMGMGAWYVGGFVGSNWGYIANSSSEGIASGDTTVGGFAGLNVNSAVIERSASSGNVIGTNTDIGGFVGRNVGLAIKDCYSTGDVYGDDVVGGFVGYTSQQIDNSYSTGWITGNTNVGGFAGAQSGGSITNCFWDMDTSGRSSSAAGTGESTAEMKKQATFTNWNFTTTWGIYDDYTYPFLRVLGSGMEADLELTLTGISPDPCNIGDTIQYYANVTNHGPDSAFNVVVNVSLPTEVLWLSDNKSAGPPVGQYLEWPVGIMDISESRSWLINVTANAAGAITATARAVSDVPDKGPYTNVDSVETHVNAPPVASDDTAIFAEDSGAHLINVLANDTDADGDALTIISVSQGAHGSVAMKDAGKSVEYTPDGNFNGADSFNYTISDGNGAVANATVNITVTAVNDAPIITTADVTNATEDAFYSVDYNATDADNDTLTWSLATNAGWLGLDADGWLNGTPTNADVGSYWVNVSVSDGNGGNDWHNFTLDVLNTNDEPVIITADDAISVEGTAYFVDYEAADDDMDALMWGLATNATWLNINTATGLLNGTPGNDDAGSYWVNVSADDGRGGTDWHNFTLTVLADTDLDGMPDNIDTDDDNDGTPDTSDDFPLDPFEDTDTDGDGTGDNADTDDDNDGWNDSVEIAGGFDPLDNSSVPGDADSDGIANFMDPDFLTTVEYHNETVNQAVWQNSTNNVTIGVTDADSDGDGWNDSVEILAGTDPLNAGDMPADSDGDGIADFMDPDPLTNTVTVTETPAWAWGALVAAIVLGILAGMMFMRGRGK